MHRTLFLLCALLSLLLTAPVAAQEGIRAQAVIALAPAVAEAAPATKARGIFFERTLRVALPAGPLLLAASPDGRTALCADDSARLALTTPGSEPVVWEHRFATADRTAIACLEPVALAVLPRAGTYSVTLTLTDLAPPTYSARPFFLLALHAGTATATASAAQELTASAPLATTPTVLSFKPTPVLPAATELPLPSVTALPLPTIGAEAPAAPRQATPPLWPIAGGLFALAGLLALLVRRRPRPRPRGSSGVLTIADRSSREVRTAILTGGKAYVLRQRPLALVAQGSDGATLATIRLSAVGVQVRAADGEEQLLAPDGSLALAGGAVTLNYRVQQSPRPRAAPLPKGRSR
jgi:hypothetical protein